MLYHQKTKKDKCPTCLQPIFKYCVINQATKTESDYFDFPELLLQSKMDNGLNQEDQANAFDCLDHAFFSSEIAKLIKLRIEIE